MCIINSFMSPYESAKSGQDFFCRKKEARQSKRERDSLIHLGLHEALYFLSTTGLVASLQMMYPLLKDDRPSPLMACVPHSF